MAFFNTDQLCFEIFLTSPTGQLYSFWSFKWRKVPFSCWLSVYRASRSAKRLSPFWKDVQIELKDWMRPEGLYIWRFGHSAIFSGTHRGTILWFCIPFSKPKIWLYWMIPAKSLLTKVSRVRLFDAFSFLYCLKYCQEECGVRLWPVSKFSNFPIEQRRYRFLFQQLYSFQVGFFGIFKNFFA